MRVSLIRDRGNDAHHEIWLKRGFKYFLQGADRLFRFRDIVFSEISGIMNRYLLFVRV
jgi:hypothetical protein